MDKTKVCPKVYSKLTIMRPNITLCALLCLVTIWTTQAQSNLALNKTAVASTELTPASFAVDGNAGTRWESAQADPQWIYVDLEESYELSSVKLTWEGAFASQYEIQLSDDLEEWTTVYTEEAGNGATDDISITGTARYVRMYGTVRGTPFGYSLWEFEVYELLAAGTDANLSDLTVDGVTISGFSSQTTTYNYGLVQGTTEVPVVSATTNDPNATFEVTSASEIPGTTTVEVTSDDESATKTYTVNFIIDTPATAAPDPERNAADVISVYSDYFTSIVTNVNPFWGQSTSTQELQIESNNALKYENLDYQGMEYAQTNVSSMEYLHLDYFTGNATNFDFYLIAGGENAYDIDSELGITTGEWVGVDIPMTAYAERNLAAAVQFKTVGNGTIWLDNVYFWKSPADPATDARLSSLTVNGVGITGFDGEVTDYSVELPFGTVEVPTVAATTAQETASAQVNDAESLPGTTTVVVTAQDGETMMTYSIDFGVKQENHALGKTTLTSTGDGSLAVDGNLNSRWESAAEDPQWIYVDLGATYTITGVRLEWEGAFASGYEIQVSADAEDWTSIFTEEAGDGGRDEIETFGIGQYVRMYGTVRGSPYGYSLWEFEVYGIEGTAETDATLSDLQVNGESLEGFASNTLSYDVELPIGTTEVPTVAATTTQEAAIAQVNDAAELPGTTTVVVTAEDEETQLTYSLNFTVALPPSDDASLADVQVNGVSIPDFDSETLEYDVELNFGTTEVPTVTATTTDDGAIASVIPAESLPGTTTINITAENGEAMLTYSIDFTVASGSNDPLEAAPTPTKDADDVISVYSDAYPSLVTNIDPFWGQATDATEIQLDGDNNTLKYENLNYQGIEYHSTDVSIMEYIHIDYFTSDATDFDFYLIAGGENAFDIDVELGITTGNWVSIDIPIATAFPERDLTAAFQFKTVGNGTIYLDNLYFWKEPTAATADARLSDLQVDGETIGAFASNRLNYEVVLPYGTTIVPTVTATTLEAGASASVTAAEELPGTTSIEVTAEDGETVLTYSIEFSIEPSAPPYGAPTPTEAPENVISIYGENYASIEDVDVNPFWGQSTQVEEVVISDDTMLKLTDFNYQGIDFNTNAQDVSGMDFVHFDIWSPNAEDLDFYLISTGPIEKAFELPVATGIWWSYDIPLSEFSDVVDMTDILQFKFDGGDGEVVMYLDNLYFYNEVTNAALSDLQVDGVSVEGFASGTLEYSIELPYGTTMVPDVTGITVDAGATVGVTDAESLPGTSTVLVTAEDTETTLSYSVTFTIADPSTDASLSDLTVDETTVSGFTSGTLSYSVELPFGTTDVPTVSGTTTDPNASIDITDAESLPGTTSIEVTAEDGETILTYTIAFTIADPSSDASLSNLQVDGVTVSGFVSGTLSYSVELPFGTTVVPTVTGTTSDSNASLVVTDAEELPGTTSILVTAEDGTSTATYTIDFSVQDVLGTHPKEELLVYSSNGQLIIKGTGLNEVKVVKIYSLSGMLIRSDRKNESALYQRDLSYRGVAIVNLIDKRGRILQSTKTIIE